MTEVLAGIGALSSLFVRIVLGFLTTVPPDTLSHVANARSAIAQNTGFFGPVSQPMALSRPLRIPLLWHFLFGRLHDQWLMRKGAILSVFIELLLSSGVAVLAAKLGGSFGVGLIAACLYVSSPSAYTTFSIGPRSVHLTPRLFSEGISFALTAVLIIERNGISQGAWFTSTTFVAACLLSGSVLLSSKFSLQFLVLVIFPAAILSGSWVIAFGIVVGLGLAISLLGRAGLEGVKTHLSHLIWYRNQLSESRLPIAERRKMWNWSDLKAADASEKLRFLLLRNPYSAVILKNPLFCVTLAICLTRLGSGQVGVEEILLLQASLVFVVSASQRFLFIGEAERYLSGVVPISAVIFANEQILGVTSALFLWSLGFQFWEIKYAYWKKQVKSLSQTARDEDLRQVKALMLEDKTLAIDSAFIGGHVLWLSKDLACEVVYPEVNVAVVDPDRYEFLHRSYPHLDLSCDSSSWIAENCDLYLFENSRLPEVELKLTEWGFGKAFVGNALSLWALVSAMGEPNGPIRETRND